MRWPLRTQIMLPMLGLMLGTLVCVTALDTYLAGRRAKQQIERQLHEVATSLENASFPLTDGVLRQMRGLSGADYILAETTGEWIASSRDGSFDRQIPETLPVATDQEFALSSAVVIAGVPHFHLSVTLQPRSTTARKTVLHILYPEEAYRQIWWKAVLPSAAVGAIPLALVVLAGGLIARRVTRPIETLKGQVDLIARGDFRPLSLPERNDELLDLSKAINRMAEMLARYEDEVRRNERLRTLGQLGGGIAHQLRNSATGCRMALDLHRRDCGSGDQESLQVANQQLLLMEEYLQRFLTIGKPGQATSKRVDLRCVVDEALLLIGPAAYHAGIELEWERPAEPRCVLGDEHALKQLVVNLLLNAVEAATRAPGTGLPASRRVGVEITLRSASELRLAVSDSGPGPAQGVRDTLFEPLVSEKPDGVGLGLSLAREVAESHKGRISWQRVGERTCFQVDLPILQLEPSRVEALSG